MARISVEMLRRARSELDAGRVHDTAACENWKRMQTPALQAVMAMFPPGRKVIYKEKPYFVMGYEMSKNGLFLAPCASDGGVIWVAGAALETVTVVEDVSDAC